MIPLAPVAAALSLSAPVSAPAPPCPAALSSVVLPPPPAERPAPAAPAPAAAAAGTADAADYRHQLRPTPYGWPRRDHWCVWVEPAASGAAAARWEQIWLRAVAAALASWGELLPISRVPDPAQAQLLVLRQRPPLRNGRASHGRAELQLALVQRSLPHPGGDPVAQLEPRVTVRISPGQRAEAIEATALHELGHGFGLWGHSDHAEDAMAAVPGPQPIRRPSPRDRATLLWLQRQPGLAPRPSTSPP